MVKEVRRDVLMTRAENKPTVMNAACGIHDVWPAKTHRVRQQKVPRLNHAGTFYALLADTFLCRIDIFPAFSGVTDHDPVHSVWVVRQEAIYRPRGTSSRNREDVFHRNQWPALAHFNIP